MSRRESCFSGLHDNLKNHLSSLGMNEEKSLTKQI